jgi:hypothetical protein
VHYLWQVIRIELGLSPGNVSLSATCVHRKTSRNSSDPTEVSTAEASFVSLQVKIVVKQALMASLSAQLYYWGFTLGLSKQVTTIVPVPILVAAMKLGRSGGWWSMLTAACLILSASPCFQAMFHSGFHSVAAS